MHVRKALGIVRKTGNIKDTESTSSMKPSCFAAANYFSYSEEILCILWKPKFHSFHRKSVPLIPDVS